MASRNRMKLQQAVWILNLSEKDDFDTAKKKYRKLMGTFHPDAVDRDQPEEIRQEYVRRSQEINEAYQVLREISEQGKWGSVQSCFEKQQRSGTNSAKGHSGQKQAGGYPGSRNISKTLLQIAKNGLRTRMARRMNLRFVSVIFTAITV